MNLILPLIQRGNYCIYIIDGSDEKCDLKKYDFDNIYYYYQKSMTFSERVIFGINKCEAEYICVTGDTKFVDTKKFKKIEPYFDGKYDLIEFSGRDKRNLVERSYHSIMDFFYDNAWDCTMFGTVFIRKKAFSLVREKDFCNQYNDNPFPHVIFYFNCIKEPASFSGLYKAVSIFKKEHVNGNDNWPNKIEIFGRRWIDCISFLENSYKPYKSQVIKDHGRYSELMIGTATGFYRLRMHNALNIEIVRQYKDILPLLTDVPIGKIVHISRLPALIAKIVYYIRRFLEKIFCS